MYSPDPDPSLFISYLPLPSLPHSQRNILAALAEHEAELKAERASTRSGSSRKSKKQRRKNKSTYYTALCCAVYSMLCLIDLLFTPCVQLLLLLSSLLLWDTYSLTLYKHILNIYILLSTSADKVVPVESLDQFDVMRRKVGTHKEIEKLTRGFVRLAKKVSKHSKLQKNALETRMDLVEACNKLRVLKVTAMLLLESTDANMKTPEDEPILLHMFMKAVRMDQISGKTSPLCCYYYCW